MLLSVVLIKDKIRLGGIEIMRVDPFWEPVTCLDAYR